METTIQGFRLSPQQERLWHVQQGDAAAYRSDCAVLIDGGIDGDLDLQRLESALEDVVERYEILRTTFGCLPGMSIPMQVIHEAGGVRLAREQGLEGSEVGAAAERLLREAARLPFDLESGPVIRAVVASLAPGRSLLCLSLPALCADARALDVLVREIAAAYDGQAAGEALQYADLAEWQHELLESGDDETAALVKAHRELAGLAGGPLPFAKVSPVAAPFAPETLDLALTPELAAATARLANERGTSIAAIVLAGWQALLRRLTGRADSVVAVGFSGRKYEELAGALGLFTRYLPVPVQVEDGLSFAQLLERVGQTLEEAHEWQEHFTWAGVAEPGSCLPFAFNEESAGGSVAGGGLTFSVCRRRAWTERFELHLSCVHGTGLPRLELAYDSRCFEREDVERLAAYLLRQIAAGVERPRADAGDADLVTGEERQRLLTGFNRTAVALEPTCVHRLFEEQAARTADETALIAGDDRLTFAELNACANRLAHHLRRLGVGPDVPVGLFLQRSAEMVIAALAVLKAGGGYVPLDPSHPRERLAFLVQDARLPLLLTEERLAAALPDVPVRVLRLDADRAAFAAESAANPTGGAVPESLAYVIYTSGSTGRPKGVLVHHQGVVNYLTWAVREYGVAAGAGAPVHSPFGFDLTVTSLFCPLLAGRPAVLLREEEGVGALAEALRATSDLSLVKLTPLHLDLLGQLLTPGEAAGRSRAFVIGGEALGWETLAFWRTHAPRTRLINEYGPTETVVGCCVYEVPADAAAPAGGGVPIGRPIANTRLYVLDAYLHPVPAGVAGELYIGGAGVARGYLGRPGLTASRFVPDPFAGAGCDSAGEAGGRLYRTGDVVRALPGGDLEYLGRIDQQVKIRGFRIEPGEIESALARHPGVREAVVLAREDQPGERRLVAYWLAEGSTAPAVATLRGFLEETLPAYMVPSAFMLLESWPLTANAKIDRRALPAPVQDRAERQAEFVAPTHFVEEVLAAIWSEVLGVGRIGIHDHFFQLGGDSIRTIEVVSKARERGLALSPQDFFQFPVLADLARTSSISTRAQPGTPAIVPAAPFELMSPADRERLGGEVVDAYPLAKLQAGMLFHGAIDPQGAVYHDLTSFHLRGPVDLTALRVALQQTVDRHPVLRTAFALTGFGEPMQLVHAEVPVPLEVEDLRHLDAAAQEAALAAWLEAEKGRPFDPSRPCLMRFQVHVRGPRELQLTLSYHHAIVDGWSVASLLSEVFRHYCALLRGEAWVPEPPAAAYRDFVALERQALASGECRAFWYDALEGSTVLSLPRRHGAGGGGVEAGRHAVALPAAVAGALSGAARAAGLPLKSLLLAAHMVVLSEVTGEMDVVTGLVAHGRPEVRDGERVVGLFLNTLPMRSVLAGGTWLELARQVFDAEREALPFRRYPLAELQRTLGGRQLFETLFNFVNFHVYQTLERVEEIEVLESTFFEATNFTLAANFIQEPDGSGLRLNLDYDASQLTAAQVQALGEAYRRALTALSDGPRARYDARPSLSPAELQQVLIEWNDTAAEPVAECLHHLFETAAETRPGAPAALFGAERLSHGELNRRANRLARRLRDLGVGPETVVGVCMERSFDLLVSLLAIFKAGGVYLPLDPGYPGERLAFMLEDAGAALVLTRELTAGAALPSLDAGPFRVLRVDAEDLTGQPDGNLVDGPGAGNLAYVIYTSGSTGRPKGVMVRHAGLARLAGAQAHAFAVRPDSRVLLFASPSFDASLSEVGMAWRMGAAIVLADRHDLLPGRGLVRLLREQAVTHATLPPAVLTALPAAGLTALETLIVAGEACPAEVAARWAGERRFFNAYGPTEVTVCATVSGRIAGDSTPPIGRPIPGTRVYLLDRRLRPVPAGATGELCVGGEGVSRGYLGRPADTAARFVPDAWSAEPGARLYRTGDLARHRPDGTLEFLGRADHQVKIRGFRIEPGEVEAVLARHPGVRQAAVVVRHDGEPRLVAYFSGIAPEGPATDELRDLLRRSLPEFMMPAAFVRLESLPLTANGKVDRRALPAPEAGRSALESSFAAPRGELERTVAAVWQEVLGVERVGLGDNFFDLGGHSLLLLEVHARLEALLGVQIPVVDLFEHSTVGTLALRLAARRGGEAAAVSRPERPETLPQTEGSDIAVIGMAGRFPGAADVERFWRNLRDGVESITFFTDDELAAAGLPPEVLDRADYVKAKGALEGADLFDAAFFGFTPREAEIMDPQQRVFLECAWEALENAGYAPEAYPGLIGVFAGQSMNSYGLNLLARPDLVDAVGSMQAVTANDKDFLATRVSYKLGLEGPSLVIQTACSTSLVSVHVACRSLLAGETDIALAGGVSVRVPQNEGYFHVEGGIDSPDGHCRAFDAGAQGTVAGNGVGIIVLKRLREALADGDTIHAVIKGSAINNDGSRKVGYTAPRVEGQARVIRAAHAAAGVDPATITYVEAHGTGTVLGDPIEIAALRQAFAGVAEGSCAIGTTKTNIGHLDAAAGIAGLIKTVQALKHGEIPPSLHFERPNPRIDFQGGPFYVNDRLAAWPSTWPAGGTPRRAGVSSFGIGGTNAHAVLEEAPPAEPSGPSRESHLLVLSARSAAALDVATARLAGHLRRHPDLHPADVAHTLQLGRVPFPYRRMLVCRDLDGAAAALEALDAERVFTSCEETRERPVAFLFSGQGAQYPGMGEGLYRAERVYREEVDRCCDLLAPRLGFDLRALLFPGEAEVEAARRRLAGTAVAQPALFVTEYALARLWMSWGVRPQAMLGHSVGEYTAACLAGVMTLEEALDLVAERGRLMAEMPAGAMLAVGLREPEVRALLADGLELAAVNAPAMCVVAGPTGAVAELRARLEEREVHCRLLETSHAFHSAMMDPILDAFAERVRRVDLKPPRIPYVSNTTGTWIEPSQATDPAYWVRHLRQTVRFGDGVAALLAEPDRVLLEVGPGQGLATLARQHPDRKPVQTVLSSLRHPKEPARDLDVLLQTLGRLWLSGLAIDWRAFHAGERRRRVELPTYPFERRRYWIEAPPEGVAGVTALPTAPHRREPVAEWLQAPSWKRAAPLSPGLSGEPRRWLLLADEDGAGPALAERLWLQGQDVTLVWPGDGFARRDDGSYTVAPGRRDDYAALLADLRRRERTPRDIVHLWTLGRRTASFDEAQETGYYSLLGLAQALAAQGGTAPLRLWVVTGGIHEVTGEEALRPELATLLGPCRVVPQECPDVTCHLIDSPAPVAVETPGDPMTRWADRLLAELASPSPETAIAHRGPYRWVQTLEPVASELGASRLRQGGVYWITGGLGRVGLALAGHLARTVGARLVLTGRTALAGGAVRHLEELGAEVLVLAADVADTAAMREVVTRIEQRFGRLDGVVHAAGIVGRESFRSILETGRAESEAQFRAKVHGVRVLAEVLRGRSLDFCLLCSSLSTVLGGLGFTAYAAANAYLDAFAQQRGRDGTFPWISVDWDAWREDEAAAGDTGISAAEGGEALERILGLGMSQVLVSSSDLQERLARWAGGAPALPEPVRETGHPRPGLSTAYVAPRNDAERVIAGVWQQLLGIEPVGVHDNFFELGGHSLLATQLVSKLREALPVAPPLRAVFETPTVSGLAAAVAAAPAGAEMPALVPVERHGDLPLSFAQQRLFFLHQLDPEGSSFNLHAGVRLEGDLDFTALARGLDEIARRHEVLRTAFAEAEGRPVQLFLPALSLPLPLLDLTGLDAAGREVETRRVAALEACRSFDLSRPPLLRARLLRLAGRQHVLLLTIHHIVWDAWSFGVFIREVGALYEALAAGRPSPLPELPVQYADFSAWQRRWLQGGVEEEQVAYWRRQLQGAPDGVALPAPRTAPGEGETRSRRLQVRVAGEISRELEALARREDATLFMVLLAAFATLLRHHAGQDDLVVGTDIANRTRAETEGLIGFFINQLALRVDLTGDPTVRELLGRVRAVTLGAYEHQDLPFDRLIAALNPRRSTSRQPLFQVKLVLQNAPIDAVRLPGLELGFLEDPSERAQLDLILNLSSGEEGLSGTVEYDAGKVDAAVAGRMSEHLETVLRAMVSNPDARLGEIEQALAESEQGRLRSDAMRHLKGLRKRPAAELVDEGVLAMVND